MANVEGKRSGDDGSAAAPVGPLGVDRVAADREMQTDKGNASQEALVEPAIDHRIQNHLGRKLKEAYDDLVRQPVPDKFHQLLEELERQEKKQ